MTHFFPRPDARELVRTIRWHEVGGGPSEKTLEQVRPFLHTHDNLIEYNEIHHAMEKLGDGNGIYVRGAGAGNVTSCWSDRQPVRHSNGWRAEGYPHRREPDLQMCFARHQTEAEQPCREQHYC
ncbi:MAG: hypothetical protein ACYTDW_22730 [Planctomycetota bacterium]